MSSNPTMASWPSVRAETLPLLLPVFWSDTPTSMPAPLLWRPCILLRRFVCLPTTKSWLRSSNMATVANPDLVPPDDARMHLMTPRAIVSELDRYIIGQHKAKRAVAIALRNRWRRQQVAEDLRDEIAQKNILMIGPTGVGKTEIARRLARLAEAPFIKVEATKFTEVGYVGKDVDSIIRDLVETAIKQAREQETRKVRHRAEDQAEERILDVLLPPAREIGFQAEEEDRDSATRQKFRKKLREGELDDKEIEIEVAAMHTQMEILAPPGMEDLTSQIQSMFQNLGGTRRKTRKLKIREAMQLLSEEEAAKLVNDEELKLKALTNVEQNGIVFLDEIDKRSEERRVGK